MYDNLEIISDSQAITASAASAGDVLLMTSPERMEPVYLDFKIVEAFNNLTSLNVKVQQTTEDDSAWASPEDVIDQTILLADLILGATPLALRFIPKVSKPRVRLYYTVAGTAPTTGEVFAAPAIGADEPIEDGLYFDPRNPSGAASSA